jgi:hypothetical protein
MTFRPAKSESAELTAQEAIASLNQLDEQERVEAVRSIRTALRPGRHPPPRSTISPCKS